MSGADGRGAELRERAESSAQRRRRTWREKTWPERRGGRWHCPSEQGA